MTSLRWMMIGTSSESSGSTLTGLPDLIVWVCSADAAKDCVTSSLGHDQRSIASQLRGIKEHFHFFRQGPHAAGFPYFHKTFQFRATLPFSRQAALDVFPLFPWHHIYLGHSIYCPRDVAYHFPYHLYFQKPPISICLCTPVVTRPLTLHVFDSRSHPHLYVPAPCHDNLSLFVAANSTVPSEDQVPHWCLQGIFRSGNMSRALLMVQHPASWQVKTVG
jgi:hypothetical protein